MKNTYENNVCFELMTNAGSESPDFAWRRLADLIKSSQIISEIILVQILNWRIKPTHICSHVANISVFIDNDELFMACLLIRFPKDKILTCDKN